MYWHLGALFVTATILLPSVTVAQKVRTDYAHGTDFSKFKTYKWVKISDNPDLNQLMDQRIKETFTAQMGKEGLTQSEDNPDLLVGYQAAVSHQTQLNTYGSTMAGGPGWGVVRDRAMAGVATWGCPPLCLPPRKAKFETAPWSWT